MITHADITPKFKMVAVKPEIHVSTFVHGISKLNSIPSSNEIPNSMPIFLGLGNRDRLVRIGLQSDVWICRKPKMAAINRK